MRGAIFCCDAHGRGTVAGEADARHGQGGVDARDVAQGFDLAIDDGGIFGDVGDLQDPGRAACFTQAQILVALAVKAAVHQTVPVCHCRY